MEVHPPHHPVTTLREALVHVGLMTVGLFIALMLEGVVEWAHHKHQVHEARENIHREIEDNHKNIQDNLRNLHDNIDLMHRNVVMLKQIEADHASGKNTNGSLSYNIAYTDLNSAAWETARNTNAVAYMPYEEASDYSGIYQIQSRMNDGVDRISKDEFRLLAAIMTGRDFKDIPIAQWEDMLNGTAAEMLNACVMAQQLTALDHEYERLLKMPKDDRQETCGYRLAIR